MAKLSSPQTSYRIERDSLGELRVPADAYYGVQTARAVANFPISGLTPALMAQAGMYSHHGADELGRGYNALVDAYLQIKKAAAIVNNELGMLDDARCKAIVAAADHVLACSLRGEWVVDVFQAGAGTSFNMNTNEV